MNLPHDAYKLLAVPSPIGGVLVIGANTIHYHSQSASCLLALNNFAVPADGSQEMSRSGFTMELDAARATWLTNDVAVFSTKSGELLLLTLVYDGRVVQRLELMKSRASVLTLDITTIGNSFFFLGSRLGDSLLVQYYSGVGAPTLTPGVKEEVGDIESDAPSTKRLRRSSSDALQDLVTGEELSFYGTGSNNAQIAQVSEVYSKELKGAISALASLQGHLLLASGPKIILHKWTGSELNGVAFYDVPPLYVVSLNIVKNFILLGDIHKSIYFLSWKEQGSQLNLLAKDFGLLDCLATEFLIDGSTLSLIVSDDQKNVQIFYYAPKMSESWKGQKLLSRAEFHVGAHITKFIRLQLLPTSSDRTTPGSDKTNRFGLLFGTLEGSIGCIAPLDELNFRRLQSLQKKLVDSVSHVAGLNPRSFRHFHSNGQAHRPGPDSILDCELLVYYEMLALEDQLDIANQIGTTWMQIMSNLNELSLATSFL